MFIRHLTLYTDKINELANFYSATLGLPLAGREAESFTLSCGQSTLTFRQSAAVPPYHFAFNIPPRQEEAALAWLKESVEVLRGDDGEITDFPAWNARAVYFTDPAGNIVEFIGRRDLPYQPVQPFGPQAVREISEIGLSTGSIKSVYDSLQPIAGVPVYSGSFEHFCALGDAHGLLICVNKDSKKWYPTSVRALPAPFELLFGQNDRNYRLVYHDERLQLMVED